MGHRYIVGFDFVCVIISDDVYLTISDELLNLYLLTLQLLFPFISFT